ncbi:hypothetical protein [Spirosoma utsteinense]|nr:hypothetical protein [Spirosoma utsteinense]MBC3785896.1 hypothetical protein [Spirosoma utsteinense]
MNRICTLLTFLLISVKLAIAQTPATMNFTLRTDLTMSPRRCLFTIDSVVSTRLDTTNLFGTWQHPSGKTTELRFKEGFQPTLNHFICSSLIDSDKKLPNYTLVVQEFALTGTPETTHFELAVLFFTHGATLQNPTGAAVPVNDNPQGLPVYKADIIVEISSKTVVEVLKQGLAIALLKFNDYLTNPATTLSIYSDFALESAQAARELGLGQFAYDSIRTDEDNLLRCSQLRLGVYQSFSELRQNRPSLTGNLVIREKNDFAELRKPSGSNARNRFFGFCDGKDLFISRRSYQSGGLTQRYVRVKSVGRYLVWIDNYITSGEIAGASFGLVGALAANYKDCIVLDMQTGGVFRVTKDKLPAMLAGHDDLLAELETLSNPQDGLQQLRLLDKLNKLVRPVSMR